MTRSDGGVAGDRLVARSRRRRARTRGRGRRPAGGSWRGSSGRACRGRRRPARRRRASGRRRSRPGRPGRWWRRGSACGGRAARRTRGPRPSESSCCSHRNLPQGDRCSSGPRPSLGLVIRLSTSWSIIGTRSSFTRVSSTIEYVAGPARHPRWAHSCSETREVRAMRIALLSYRSKPHCGGQGIYLRHLSRELTALGHTRRGVLRAALPGARRGRDAHQGPEPGPLPRAGPVPGAEAQGVPRPDRRRGVRDHVRGRLPRAQDVQHRAWRELLQERADDFDIVHDNQVLGYGMLEIEEMGLPLVTTIHHPITFDRRIDIAQTKNPWREAHAQPLVRLPADAGPGRPPGPQDPHAVGDLQARHRQGLRRRPGADAGHPARRRRRLRAADRRRGCPAGSWRWPAPTPR